MGKSRGLVTVDVVVPCFNEEASLPLFFIAYTQLAKSHPEYTFSLIVIDNGSTDATLKIARSFIETIKDGMCIELSKNFGKEASLTAGL